MIELKPNSHLLALCAEMFKMRIDSGQNYPDDWRVSSRKKLESTGIIENKGNNTFYFTESGLSWFLKHKKA